jgi:hypothetical protein
MIREQLVDGHGHDAAPLEDRHESLHRSLPEFYPAVARVSRLRTHWARELLNLRAASTTTRRTP